MHIVNYTNVTETILDDAGEGEEEKQKEKRNQICTVKWNLHFFPLTQLYSYCVAIYLNGFCFVFHSFFSASQHISFAVVLVLRSNSRFNQIVIRMYYYGNVFRFWLSFFSAKAHMCVCLRTTRSRFLSFFCCADVTFRFD